MFGVAILDNSPAGKTFQGEEIEYSVVRTIITTPKTGQVRTNKGSPLTSRINKPPLHN